MKGLTKEYIEELAFSLDGRLVEHGNEVAANEYVFGYVYDDEILTAVVLNQPILSGYIFNMSIASVPSLISSDTDFRIRDLPRTFGQSRLGAAEQSLNKREWVMAAMQLDQTWTGVEEGSVPPEAFFARFLVAFGAKSIPCWNCFADVRIANSMNLGTDRPYDSLLMKIICRGCGYTLYHLTKSSPDDPQGVAAYAKWEAFSKKIAKCLQVISNGMTLPYSGYGSDSIKNSLQMAVNQLRVFQKERLPCYHCKSEFEVAAGLDQSGQRIPGQLYVVKCTSCDEVLYASSLGLNT